MGEILELLGDCPRCGHKIPNDDTPGAFAGALSRTDNATMICSACGTHEALLQAAGENIDQSTWPVEVPVSLYEMHKPERS